MSRRPLPLIVVAEWCGSDAGQAHPPVRRLLAVLLSRRMSTGKGAFPKQETLALEVGLSPRQVRTHLAALGELLVVHRRGQGRANLYEIRPEILASHQAAIDRHSGPPLKSPVDRKPDAPLKSSPEQIDRKSRLPVQSGSPDFLSHIEHYQGTSPGKKTVETKAAENAAITAAIDAWTAAHDGQPLPWSKVDHRNLRLAYRRHPAGFATSWAAFLVDDFKGYAGHSPGQFCRNLGRWQDLASRPKTTAETGIRKPSAKAGTRYKHTELTV